MPKRNMRFTPVERQWPRPFSDRAAIVATAIMQIVADVRHKPAELRLRIVEYLRDEFAASNRRSRPTDGRFYPRCILPQRRMSLTFELVFKNSTLSRHQCWLFLNRRDRRGLPRHRQGR